MLKIAEDAARAGGKILTGYFRTDLTIEHKGVDDLVTKADRKAEETIVSHLKSEFPSLNSCRHSNGNTI